MTNDKKICKAMSAVAHLIEYIDTNEPFDLQSAASILNDPEMSGWVKNNSVLMPARRDGVAHHTRHQNLLDF